jgi:hypothetical protein
VETLNSISTQAILIASSAVASLGGESLLTVKEYSEHDLVIRIDYYTISSLVFVQYSMAMGLESLLTVKESSAKDLVMRIDYKTIAVSS